MAEMATTNQRVRVDGKFFRLGEKKFFVKGVTYGPFAPNAGGEPYPPEDRAAKDLELVRDLNANTLRVYHVPPKWFLDLAGGRGLKVLVDVPWWKTGCFLDSARTRREGLTAVRQAARACAGHPAVLALSVVNEIAPDVARWHGHRETGAYLDELVAAVKEEDAGCLTTFGNFPSSEYLSAPQTDFVCFNVYLHEPRAFASYLARLQMLAHDRPLVLGEFGVDTRSEGPAVQRERLAWQIEAAFRGGLAGACVFSLTDEWHKDGRQVTGWEFGLVDAERRSRPAFAAVLEAYAAAPRFPLPRTPRASVVVATYNGARTLEGCLKSLQALNYPDYEVIVVDDGSTDRSGEIARAATGIRLVRQENRGLSAARNAGIAAATGEWIAFTDDDCRVDEDWLHYLAQDLLSGGFDGIGGHNLLPADDSPTAAAVMASPGGPAHVMLNDREAEHLPGCNMAFRKSALLAVGGFDPVFRKAGDDVDLCWRLQQRGFRLGFSPAGMVWHHRRATAGAYLRQQHGYGEAEAMLVRKHPDHFNALGAGRWKGRIYGARNDFGLATPIIYRGRYAEGLFQSVYSGGDSGWAALLTSLEWNVAVTLPLLVLAYAFQSVAVLAPALVCAAAWFGVCAWAGATVVIPLRQRRFWSRPLVALLHLLQPLVRGWARHLERFAGEQKPLARRESLDTLALRKSRDRFEQLAYWSEQPVERKAFVEAVLEKLRAAGWARRKGSGWCDFDLEVFGGRWCRCQLITVTEWHTGGREMLRVRLRTRWSLVARVALAGSVALALAGARAWEHSPWMSLLPLLLPLGVAATAFAEGRSLRRILSVLLDQVAAGLGFKKVNRAAAADSNAGSTTGDLAGKRDSASS